ncbi:hypothetical protein B0H15DRAFT_949853 [Mycena belliarum]|uniref:Protein-S-isoprenylcysteine O-methyltransferase n=1 Tax=Mycena belliarum TaxID=1033014 RepID=A0AAD6XRT2_9AGAR|nr:hypothetical protein B0H15DRAFT_949853 [Mycena belliae]
MKVGHLLAHTSFWACCLAEIAVIVAHCAPNSVPASSKILGTLDRTGSAPRLNILPHFFFGWLLNLLGGSLRLHCYSRLRTLFTFELSIRENHHLITSGVYSIVRHPSYTGAVLAGVGVALCTLTPGSWIVECSGLVAPGESWVYKVVPIWIVGLSLAYLGLGSRMRKEDRMLHEKFGAEWEAWAARVRYKIIPGVY